MNISKIGFEKVCFCEKAIAETNESAREGEGICGMIIGFQQILRNRRK
jgi:hypothetical protein